MLQPNSPEAQRQSDRWRLAETISAVAVATRRPLRTPARWPIEQSPPRQLPHRSRGHGGDRASKRLAPHRIPTAKSRDCFCFTRTYLFGLVWKPKSLQGSPSIPGVGSPRRIFPREAHHALLEALCVGFFCPGKPNFPVETGPASRQRAALPLPRLTRESCDSARRTPPPPPGSPPPTCFSLRCSCSQLLLRIR